MSTKKPKSTAPFQQATRIPPVKSLAQEQYNKFREAGYTALALVSNSCDNGRSVYGYTGTAKNVAASSRISPSETLALLDLNIPLERQNFFKENQSLYSLSREPYIDKKFKKHVEDFRILEHNKLSLTKKQKATATFHSGYNLPETKAQLKVALGS